LTANGLSEKIHRSVEEIEIGGSSVAAPIRIGNVGATFSIGATGPIRRFKDSYRSKVGAELRDLAQKVSLTLQLYGSAE